MRSYFSIPACWWVAVSFVHLFSASSAFGQPFINDINRWTAQDALAAPPANAVLFIGSSSIRRWEHLTRDFSDYVVIQRGFGGAQFDDVNTYVNDIVIPYAPAAIVIWAGTNDIAAGSSGFEVFSDFQAFSNVVLGALPNTQIAYLGITPTPGRYDNLPEETAANNAISAIAANNPSLHYVDLPAAFFALNPPNDPAFTGKFVDPIHLNREGYELWASVIRPAVESIIAPNKVFTPNVQSPAPGRRVYFDFGPSNTDDGDPTTSPDVNGNHWNNWHPATGGVAINAGERITNLVDDQGGATGIDLMIAGGFLSNGKLNGGLIAPDAMLLDTLAIATATQDYFYCGGDGIEGDGDDDAPGGFYLSGLDPALSYQMRFFASRDSGATRITEYQVFGAISASVTVQSSGQNIGSDGAYDGNDNTTGIVRGIRPDAFGQVFVDVVLLEGNFAYINAMELLVTLPGDANDDFVIDGSDVTAFLDCLIGPDNPATTDCERVFDLNVDGDVDLADVQAFALAAS